MKTDYLISFLTSNPSGHSYHDRTMTLENPLTADELLRVREVLLHEVNDARSGKTKATAVIILNIFRLADEGGAS